MLRPWLLCTLTMAALAVPNGMAQKDTTDYLNVRGLKLRLGMTQDTVLAGFAKQGLKVTSLFPDKGDGRTGWFVTDPSLPSDRQRTIVDLRFVRSKLSGVS
jgi:hypothetical protein